MLRPPPATALAFSTAVALGAPGCSTDGHVHPDGGGASDGASSGADLAQGGDLARFRPDLAYPTGGVKGQLLDESDAPLPGVTILACNATDCLFGTTAAEGRFEIGGSRLTDLALKTNEDGKKSWAEAVYPVKLTEPNVVVDVGRMWIPRLPPPVMLGPDPKAPQTLDLGDGLQITVTRELLEFEIGVDDKAPQIPFAARRVAEARWPAFNTDRAKIVAVYALFPFATESHAPVAMKIATDLPAGTVVELRTVSKLDGLLSPPSRGTVSMDGRFIVTDPGEGPRSLTWLVISRT